LAPHLVGECNKNNDIESFLTSIDIRFGNNTVFYDALQQADYDIVYIDFTEGTDDIRRNAALFQEVVGWVNQQKQLAGSTEPNVVMGESMGGLVARYGLAQMARNFYNHQIRLLVLHDSPQRGANNPMGLQALTRQADFPVALLPGNYSGNSIFTRTSDLSDKLKEALAVLDAPATKQLSLKSVTGISGQYEDNTFVDGPYKDMVDFTDIGGTPAGFPPIIATSDGSQCGRAQNTPPYQELTRNNQDYILGFSYIVRTGIQSEAVANALPDYGTQRTIAYLRVWSTLRVLWATYDATLLEREYPSPANTLPYETLPGGTVNLNDQRCLTENYSRNFIGFYRFANNTSLYNGDICFVPTYSALDVPTVTSATAYAKYINSQTDNPSIPRVLRYIAQENVNGSGTQFNQAHIRFTARNSEWIFSQMQGTPPPCSAADAECTIPRSITGPDVICPNNSATYAVSNPPAGLVFTWSSSNTALATIDPSTGVATRVGNGTVTFTATASSGCSGITLSKQVTVGTPLTPAFTYSNSLSMCYGQAPVGDFGTSNVQPGVSYAWDIVDQATAEVALNGNGSMFYFNSASLYPGSFQVTMRASACGATTSRGLTLTINDCGGGGMFRTAAVYPNPATDVVTVQLPAGARPPAWAGVFDAVLFDRFGQQRRTGRGQRDKAELDVRTLPNGLYYLRIGTGNNAAYKQVQVAH
jgi:hypothetical protein